MRSYLALLFLSVFLVACGGGGGSGGSTTGTTIPVGSVSGVTFDGLISNANVNVYDFSTGAKGALLGHGVSDSKGQYSLSLQVESRPILLEITDGTYTEEAVVNNPITLNATGAPPRRLSALANYTTGSAAKIAITSFTHMAAGLAAYEISKGTAVAAAINDANGRVSALAGLNVLSTMPIQVTDPLNANGTLTPELKYGFLEAAISMWTNNNAPAGMSHIQPYTSIDFMQQLYQDISADGLLDGFGLDNTGAKVQLTFGTTTTKLGVDVYRLGLGVSMLQMAANPANKSTWNTAGLSPYAQAYVANTDAMFNNVRPLPLPSPTVSITSPMTNTWGRKLVNVTVSATDTTFGLGTVGILIDNVPASSVAITATIPPTTSAAPTFTVNTTSIPDGVHTIGVKATNIAGMSTTNSIQLKIDNTPPTSTVLVDQVLINPCAFITSLGLCLPQYQVNGVTGTALDAPPPTSTAAPSGVASVVVVGLPTPTTPAATGYWYIAGDYPGSTVRVKDVAGNCTDYIDSALNYTWSTVVRGSCP